jgi:L-threonine kinase
MPTNPDLYRNFPQDIRSAYSEVVPVNEVYKRHNLLIQLAETTLEYLASVALSDYRSRYTTPSPHVEGLLDRLRMSSLTMGRTFDLFRESAGAAPDSLFPRGKPLTAKRLVDAGRLAAAMDGIKGTLDSLSPSRRAPVLNVDVCVSRALKQSTKRLTWWGAWETLVEYRNCVAHAAAHRWPLYSDRYYDVLTPLLEDAVVDVLTYEPVARAILDHPVASLTMMSENPDHTTTHTVCGEARGTWFDAEIVMSKPVTEIWGTDEWRATTGAKFILDSEIGEPPAVRALYWDLPGSPPPPLDVPAAPKPGEVKKDLASQTAAGRAGKPMVGRGVAPGTCGEFAQGPLPGGDEFHVTCPINKSSTVDVEIWPADHYEACGLLPHQKKLDLALKYTCEHVGLGGVDIEVRQWSNLEIGKGMGSSTADVLAGIRAVAAAASKPLTAEDEGQLATKVESSDGTMYPGIAAVNQKTGVALRRWEWYPEFAIVMLVPHEEVLTESIGFEGKDMLAGEYEAILAAFDSAIDDKSIERFAETSTQAAQLNADYLVNTYAELLIGRLGELNALGLNVGHTGTVSGLLYPNTRDGRERASAAALEIRRWFTQLRDVTVVTTPRCPAQQPPGSLDERDERDEPDNNQ